MAKLLPCTFLCLLLVIAATACHPKPPRTTPFPGGPTTTSPKFTGPTSAHSSTRSTPRPTTTKPLPKDVQEIVDALNEADESSQKASETLKKILEGGEVATEIAEAFVEDIPIVGGLLKAVGGVFSMFSKSIEDEMIMKELEKIFDEMQQQFAMVNNRLDMLAWQAKDMMNEISMKLAQMQLNEQFDKIVTIQGAKKRYENHTDSTTLQGLRDACKKPTDPSEVIDVLASMITTATRKIASIADTMKYDGRKWSAYTTVLGKNFVQAMILEQACLGVKINDDKTRPTAEDRQLYANVSSAKFVVVMRGMAAIAKQIDAHWFDTGLPNDVAEYAVSTYSQSTQNAADTIYKALSDKYGFLNGNYMFAVFVYKTDNDQAVTNNVFDSQKAMVSSYQDRTIVVIWAPKSDQHSNQKSLADKAGSQIPCNWEQGIIPLKGEPALTLSNVQSHFTKAIASSDYGRTNYNLIHFVASKSNLDIGMAYDRNYGPAYFSGNGSCKWSYMECIYFNNGGRSGRSCDNPKFSFAYSAIFGF